MSIVCNNQGNVPVLKIPVQTPTHKTFIKQGDTIEAIPFEFVNLPFALTDSGVEFNVKIKKGNQVLANYSVGNGTTIVSATEVEIDQILSNNFPDGILWGDVQLKWIEGGETITWTFCNIEYTITKKA